MRRRRSRRIWLRRKRGRRIWLGIRRRRVWFRRRGKRMWLGRKQFCWRRDMRRRRRKCFWSEIGWDIGT